VLRRRRQFDIPEGVVVNPIGGNVYVADTDKPKNPGVYHESMIIRYEIPVKAFR